MGNTGELRALLLTQEETTMASFRAVCEELGIAVEPIPPGNQIALHLEEQKFAAVIVDFDNPPRVIVLTTFDLDQYVYAALSAGASGFLLKDVTPEHLVAAVRLVQSGDALLAPTITRRLVERFASRTNSADALHRELASLTPRELEVLELMARGLSNAELAARFQLSSATVKTHVARILSKLQLRDRAQAVVVAYETGLVTPGAKAES